MSQFIVERALAPAEGDAAQLFIIFITPDQVEPQGYALMTALAQTFATAGIVMVVPKPATQVDSAMYKVLEGQVLSNEELREFALLLSAECEHLILHLQERFGVSSEATALVATSQLASAILELTKLPKPLAGRVITFGARYAELPNAKLSLDQTVHFLHAAKDPVVPVIHLSEADTAFAQFEGDATIDVAHILDDSFHPDLVQKMLERLLTCVPLRIWLDAQGMQSSTVDEDEKSGDSVQATGPGPEDSLH